MTAVDERMARAAWSRLAEPGDVSAGALVGALGAADALAWLHEATQRGPMRPALPDLSAELAGSAARLERSVSRWAGRLAEVDAVRDLRAIELLGGRTVIPGDPEWPGQLEDLGPRAPLCLWVRGQPGALERLDGSAALVGARASTGYGDHVAAEIAVGLADRGRAVVSGGAYGVDAAAHRGALAAAGSTVAVLAGGVDRLYPAGNASLLHTITEAGALVSEVPPGSVPTRARFLQRNRVIAAVSAATVVVEAAWRSGALSTAGHAADLLRPVGAVPGPVTSAASAGCHRLLREGRAVCVTDVEEVLELAGPAGNHLPGDRDVPPADHDGLDEVALRTLDALLVGRALAPEELARSAGLGIGEVRAELGRLELLGLARREGDGWRRHRRPAR